MKILKNKPKKFAEPAPKPSPPVLVPIDKCAHSLGRALAGGNGPPGDRGACEHESTTQGSE